MLPRLPRPAKPTTTQFRERFAEFADPAQYADDLVQSMLDAAYQLSAVSTEATLYLTAHLVTIDAERAEPLDGGSGEIASESVGGRAVSYLTMAKEAGGEVFYTRTYYGRTFMALQQRTPARAFSARIF